VVGKPTDGRRTVKAHHEQQLLAQLETHRDATLQKHADLLEAAPGLKVSYKTVDRVFRRHKITHKKTLVARERCEELRTQFLNDLTPYLKQPERLVFVDESGFHVAMTRGMAVRPAMSGPLTGYREIMGEIKSLERQPRLCDCWLGPSGEAQTRSVPYSAAWRVARPLSLELGGKATRFAYG